MARAVGAREPPAPQQRNAPTAAGRAVRSTTQPGLSRRDATLFLALSSAYHHSQNARTHTTNALRQLRTETTRPRGGPARNQQNKKCVKTTRGASPVGDQERLIVLSSPPSRRPQPSRAPPDASPPSSRLLASTLAKLMTREGDRQARVTESQRSSSHSLSFFKQKQGDTFGELPAPPVRRAPRGR